MVDDRRLDIKKVIADNAHITDVSNLASRGVKRVKVLDENTLQEMIRQAIEQVVSTQTAEERSKILADSRKQLQKLMNERDEFASHANLMESGKNDLIAQIEKLQEEIRLRRTVEETEAAQQKKNEDLASENSWLREEHDKMVDQLDQAQSEIKRLNEEIERLKAEIEDLKAEIERLRAGVREGEERTADAETLAKELEASQAELNELRGQLEESRQAGETAAAAVRHELDRVREETHKEAMRRAEVEKRFKEAEEEAARLREEQERAAAPPPPPPEALEEAPPAPKKGPERIPILLIPSGLKAGKGLDIGTVNLVSACQNERAETEIRLQRNVFIDVEITPYTKAMLTKLDVGYVVQGKRMYILGEAAFQLANVLNRRTRRPMKDGLISPKESDALPVMKLLIGSILGDPRGTDEVCFYSVPGEPIDNDLSVAYHRDLFDAVLKSLGYKPSHILEGHAVTFAELADEDFTGIGVSCGGGMFNVCVAYKSMPALTFSSARSGDWVDMNVAQALGIKPEKAAQLKEKGVDLMKPMNREEDAIAIYYRNLIQYNITNIAERFRSADNMPTFNDPITIVFSGGTSMAGNFIELVKDVFAKIEFPIPVKEIRMAKDPLNATAKGALVAAQLEMANQASS
jgi:predicted  nucleic acid-binding Zn-ribbon protein